MTTDERNFRSIYYEKVGCRSVEEKRSLNILLKENNPINKSKLKRFLLLYSVPVEQRMLLWSIILDITPLFPTNNEFVLQQRTETYEDLLRALQTLRYVDCSTPKHKVIFLMWALEKRLIMELHFNEDHCLTRIIKTLIETFDDDVMIYWIAREFYVFSQEVHVDINNHLELFKSLLEKDDIRLFNHSKCLNLFDELPLDTWCTNCFAGVLSGPALVRIWDKICGGSRKIVAFVLLMLFKTLKKNILDFNSPYEVISLVEKGNHQNDLIVNKAIEVWHNSKTHGEIVDH